MNKETPPHSFPTADDIRHYEDFGYVISPTIIPRELIEEARYGADRYFAGERDFALPVSGGYLDWRTEHGLSLQINDYVSLQLEEFQRLVACSHLGYAFARLADTDEVRLFHDQLISKPPGLNAGSAVGWHVDGAYWGTCSSRKMLTAWIPLEEYDADMGPIMVVPGSHKWPGTDWMKTFNERDLAALEKQFAPDGRGVEKAVIQIKPGQVSFHHARTIHGSLPNNGTRRRLALTVHVQDKDNRYRQHRMPDDRLAVHVNDALCKSDPDGLPDYMDPDICPQLWPSEV